MSSIKEFFPVAGYPNLIKTWRIYGLAFLIFSVPAFLIKADLSVHLFAVGSMLVVLTIVLVTDRSAV